MAYILYTDLSTYAFSSSAVENESYPVSNLGDYHPTSKWVSGDATGSYQWVSVDFGENKTCDAIALSNSNIDSVLSSGQILLQSADDSAFTTNLFNVLTIEYGNAVDYFSTFDSLTSRYWRVIYSGSVNEAPYIGNMFLDSVLDIPRHYTYGYKKDDKEFKTTENAALNGVLKTSQPYGGRIRLELMFRYVTTTVKDNFVRFIDAIRGKLYPFYFIGHDDVVYYVYMDSDYTPAIAVKYRLNDIQTMKLKCVTTQELASDTMVVEIQKIPENEQIITVE